ncbi:MAG: HAMP domain-containing protein [Nitrospirae bacterium]|nr:HAMP domain-containing protein [Nitrospirota bacterium]
MRLTAWFFIIAMLPLIMVNVAIYFHMVSSIKSSIFNRLEAVRDMKVAELDHWLEERTVDIRTIADDSGMRALEGTSQRDEGDIGRKAAIASEARSFLTKYLEHYDDFYEIFIVDPDTKTIMISTIKDREGHRPVHAFHFEGALKSGDLFIEDIHYSSTVNRPCMAISIPIFSREDRGRPIGVLVARFNLEASLYKHLSNRTGMGETGETFIVNKDAVVVSNLRGHGNSPLKVKIEGQAAEASRGEPGIAETSDYRGEKVLAAYTYIPQTRWGFIAKQDLKEVYAPIDRLRIWMIAIFVATVLGVVIVAFRVAKTISNPIKALHKGSEIIGQGNLDYRVGTDAKDEIGQLSRIFDQMIENLRSYTASWEDLNREMTERKHLEKMLLEIREHEQRRIGHDLHDNLGQQLTAISFMTQGLENLLRKKALPEAEDAARITHLVEMSKSQVRTLSSGLSPILEKGEYSLMTALVELASNSERLFGIPCDLRCKPFVMLYDETALTHLYRIAQEAITNAARHSKAKHIELRLTKENNKITMTIKDDGRGFIMPKQMSSMGLEIMKFRASIINASLDIRSVIGEGTLVTCIFFDKRESEINMAGEGKSPAGSIRHI